MGLIWVHEVCGGCVWHVRVFPSGASCRGSVLGVLWFLFRTVLNYLDGGFGLVRVGRVVWFSGAAGSVVEVVQWFG